MKQLVFRLSAPILAIIFIGMTTFGLRSLADPSPFTISGSTTFISALFCPKQREACGTDDFKEVPLPHFYHVSTIPDQAGLSNRRFATYRFNVPETQIPRTLPAVFIPSFSDNLRIWVNGKIVTPNRFDQEPFHHHWHRPYYTSFLNDVIRPGLNTLEVELTAKSHWRLALSEVLLGPAQTLDLFAQRHHVQRLGYVRTYVAIALFSTIPIFLFG